MPHLLELSRIQKFDNIPIAGPWGKGHSDISSKSANWYKPTTLEISHVYQSDKCIYQLTQQLHFLELC